jgi:hypothetical protein
MEDSVSPEALRASARSEIESFASVAGNFRRVQVLLSEHKNVMVHRSPYGPSRFGETALFDSYTADGRAVQASFRPWTPQ